MKANTLTAERLHALAELYQQGQVSDLMDRTLEKLLRHIDSAVLSIYRVDCAAHRVRGLDLPKTSVRSLATAPLLV